MLRFLGRWFAFSVISGLLLGRFMRAGKGPALPDDERRDEADVLRSLTPDKDQDTTRVPPASAKSIASARGS